jgi:transcriptional regulator with XRE-family HTH domain
MALIIHCGNFFIDNGCRYVNFNDMKVSTLKEWRKRKGLRQEDVAVRFGVSKPTISRLENGHRMPSLTLAVKLSKQTGIPIKLLRPDLAKILEAS